MSRKSQRRTAQRPQQPSWRRRLVPLAVLGAAVLRPPDIHALNS